MQQEGVPQQQQAGYYPQVIPAAPQQEIVVIPSEQIGFLPQQQMQQQPKQIIIVEPNQVPIQQSQRIQQPQRIQVIREDSGNDDPSCIYIAACISIIIPLIGLITLCCYSCGSNLGQRQRRAFQTLILCIFIGIILQILFGYYSY